MVTQVIAHFLDKTWVLQFHAVEVPALSIKRVISQRLQHGIPPSRISLLHDGKVLDDEEYLNSSGSMIIRASPRKALSGGKGGFGAMLRYLHYPLRIS